MSADHDDDHSAEPLIRVVRGVPTPEELAALVGVLLTRTRPTAAARPLMTRSLWVASARPGGERWPAGWRASGLPLLV